MHKILLILFLLTVSETHGMETVEKEIIEKNEKIYSLFTNSKIYNVEPTEAKKLIPHNQHELTSLFKYGVEKDNVQFIQWLLDIKKPFFDEQCLQKSFNLSSSYHRPAITLLLETYITTEKNKRQQELDKYIKKEQVKITEYKKAQYASEDNTPQYVQKIQPECTCIIS